MDGRGLNPFNHHFLPAGTKPPLTGWKRTSIFLLGFIQCQKAFTASARVLGMQRQCPGRAGGWVASPPSSPPPIAPLPAPCPRRGHPQTLPHPARAESHCGRGEGWGPRPGGGGGGGGFPSSGLILLGSSTAQRWLGPGMERGQAACVVSPPLYCGGGFSTKPSWFWPGKGEGRSLHPPPGTQLSIPPASVLERPHSFPTDGHGGPRGRGQAGISGWS